MPFQDPSQAFGEGALGRVGFTSSPFYLTADCQVAPSLPESVGQAQSDLDIHSHMDSITYPCLLSFQGQFLHLPENSQASHF